MSRSPDTIYFRCSRCRRELEIEAGAVGHLTPCPACGHRQTVPARSMLTPVQRRRLLLLAAVGLLVLPVGAGLLLRDAPPPRAVRAATAGPPAAPQEAQRLRAPAALIPEKVNQEVRALESANRRLAEETLALRRQMESVMGWVLNNFRGKFPLAEKFMRRLHVPPVTDDFQIHPELAELLNLRDEEKVLVNDAFVASASSMAEIESSMMTVSQSDPGRVTIHIPAYPEDGAALRDDLYSALETAVGGGRFDRLLDVSEDDLTRNYHYFGAATRTMIMELAYPTNGYGPTELLIRDGWILPTGENQREVHLTESRVTSLPKSYFTYRNVLPDHFLGAIAQ